MQFIFEITSLLTNHIINLLLVSVLYYGQYNQDQYKSKGFVTSLNLNHMPVKIYIIEHYGKTLYLWLLLLLLQELGPDVPRISVAVKLSHK